MRFLLLLLTAAAFACTTLAQTLVEAAALTAASSTGTAAAGIGKTTANALSKTLGKLEAGNTKTAESKALVLTPSGTAAKAAKPAPPPPKPAKADFEAVEVGMSRQDLLAKVGPPLFSISMADEGKLQESLSYTTKENDSAKIRVTDGKITSIDWMPAPKPAAPAN